LIIMHFFQIIALIF